MERYKSDSPEVKNSKRRAYADMERFSRCESIDKLREEPYQLKAIRLIKSKNNKGEKI